MGLVSRTKKSAIWLPFVWKMLWSSAHQCLEYGGSLHFCAARFEASAARFKSVARFRDAKFKTKLKCQFSAIFEQIFCIFSIPVAYWLRGLKLGVRDSKWSTLARKKNLDFFSHFPCAGQIHAHIAQIFFISRISLKIRNIAQNSI